MNEVIIVSAGKFGREVYGYVLQSIQAGAPWRFKGFLDSRERILSDFGYDLPILGDPATYAPAAGDRFINAVAEPALKRSLSEGLMSRGAQFENLIHPNAVVGPHVRLGRGVILAPFVALTSDISIGNFVTFSSFSGAAHDSIIGDFVQISSHCSINGNCEIGEGAFLGSHATILPSATIGAWAYVGAGSVVLRKVKPGQKVFGNPAIPVPDVAASHSPRDSVSTDTPL